MSIKNRYVGLQIQELQRRVVEWTMEVVVIYAHQRTIPSNVLVKKDFNWVLTANSVKVKKLIC